MRSVRRRLSIPSTTRLTWSGRLLSPGRRVAGLLIDVPTELRCNNHLVPERRDAFAENSLHLMWAVSLCGVEERDAAIEGCPDDAYHFGPRWDRRLVSAAHILHADADAGDFE